VICRAHPYPVAFVFVGQRMSALDSMMQWLFLRDISLLMLIKHETDEKELLFRAGEEARIVIIG